MNKIYVGNLPYNTTEQELKDTFSQYGAIESVILIKDRMTGRSKGFGFVVFNDNSSAQSALGMNGQPMNGRNLKVNIARENPQFHERGGERGGRSHHHHQHEHEHAGDHYHDRDDRE